MRKEALKYKPVGDNIIGYLKFTEIISDLLVPETVDRAALSNEANALIEIVSIGPGVDLDKFPIHPGDIVILNSKPQQIDKNESGAILTFNPYKIISIVEPEMPNPNLN